MLMIVFGIYCNFFIVLPIRLKTCRSNAFFSFKAICARTKNWVRLRFAQTCISQCHNAAMDSCQTSYVDRNEDFAIQT